MTLEIFNSIVAVLSLLVAIFATSKTFSLENKIKTINKTLGNNSPNQNVSGSGNITAGQGIQMRDNNAK